MNILVLGGNGFLGLHIVEEAKRLGLDVDALDIGPGIGGGNAKRFDIHQLTPDRLQGFDRVFHLAGMLGTAETFGYEAETVKANVLGTLTVLEAARVAGVQVTYVTLANSWLNPYTITKNAAADFCRMYQEHRGLDVQIVVTYNVYGRYQKWAPVRKIVPTFLYQLLKERKVTINGNGRQIVDLVYAADFAREILATREPGTLHIGTGRALTVETVAGMCAIGLGIDSYEKEYVPMRPGEPENSTSLSPNGYHHITETPPEEAMAETAGWYRQAIEAASLDA